MKHRQRNSAVVVEGNEDLFTKGSMAHSSATSASKTLVKRPRILVIKLLLFSCIAAIVSVYFSFFSRDIAQYQSLHSCLTGEPGCNSFFWARAEFGFKLLLISIVHLFNFPDFRTIWFALTAVSLGLKFFVFERNLRHPNIAGLIYFLSFFPLLEMTQIRLAVALGIWVLSLHFAARKAHTLAWIFLIFSFSVHHQIGLLAIPQLVFFAFRKDFSTIVYFFFGAIFGAAFHAVLKDYGDEYLNPLIKAYLQERRQHSIQSTFLTILIVLFPLLATFWGRQANCFSRHCQNVLAFIAPFLLVFYDIPVFFYRLSDVAIFLIAICSVNFLPRQKLQVTYSIFLILTVCLSIIRFSYFFYFQPLFSNVSGPSIFLSPW